MARALEFALRRERLVLGSLVALGVIAWVYLFHAAAEMTSPTAGGMPEMADMPGMAMGASDTGAVEPLVAFLLLAVMWVVMMIGMMLPSAAPTILLFAAVERKRQPPARHSRTAFFVCGYFLAWGAFSTAAAMIQTGLAGSGMLSPQMSVTSALVGAAVFVLAGLYEFTPLKRRCLTHCRSPLEWLSQHSRPGPLGALRMGAEHGVYCVGCCWMLMLLLFIGGVMNLIWVAAIAAVVLVEKLLPGGALAARFAGGALVLYGLFIAITAL